MNLYRQPDIYAASCLATFALLFALACPVDAQGTRSVRHAPVTAIGQSDPLESNAQDSQAREFSDTVAILPWSYKNGKDPAVQSSRETCNQLLLETGFNVFLVRSPTGAMPPAVAGTSASKREEPPFEHLLNQGRALLGQEVSNRSNSPFVLPTLEQMTEIGEKLGTRFVVAGRAQWTSRNVWIGISNRNKSICTVDLLIVDRNSQRLVLDARNVVGDSTEKKSPFTEVTSAIALNPLPLVIPGSITPQEQRAVAVAVAKAMAPWLKTERIRMALAQADASSEAAAGANGPPTKFSTLTAPVSDLQAGLSVTVLQNQPLAELDSDLAKLYELHDVTLEYKERNRLRLSATSSKDGFEALVINEDSRGFVVPERKIVHEQDLSGAPERRLFLLDFCGLLTNGMFDTMRARFVRQDRMGGADTVVYDLTYWGVDDGSYRRIWIDLGTHLVVRSEFYARDGKLRFITLFRTPHEIAPHLWLPSRVQIQNAGQKQIATIELRDARTDNDLPDDSFTIPTPQKANAWKDLTRRLSVHKGSN